MSYPRPIEMSEYPPRSVAWEADDYGLSADERNVMYGVSRFYRKCLEVVELWLRPRSFWRSPPGRSTAC